MMDLNKNEIKIFQKAFDKACSGVLYQGGKSMINNSCAYRGNNGRKCTIGHLLTDAQIKKYRVHENMPSSLFSPSLIKTLFPGIPLAKADQFLSSLQWAHDYSNGLETFEISSGRIPTHDEWVASFKKLANVVATKFSLKSL